MSDIKVRIYGEFQKKGFKDAEKATSSLDKSFKKLGKTLFGLFAAREIINFGRASVQAFAEEDKAVKNLTQSLRNLGLGYNVGAIENFISATQAATGVSDDQLRPAMVELVQVTMDAQKATNLLATAMDLSAGTGSSLDSAVTALSRAYNGNYASLGKLQRVYTTAELEAMGFEKAVSSLNSTFGGTAAANADSYQGKLDRLSIAFDEAKETVGKGLVEAFEKLADGDFDKLIDGIAWSASKLASFMNNIAFSIQYTKALLKTGWTIGKDEQAQLDMIRAQWMKPTDTTNTAAANRAFLRDMKSQLALQKKIATERAKSAALSDKEKKNQEALAKAKGVFDLEKIQIEAALQGKITEEERIRLQLMKAIAEENVGKTEELLKKLKEIQDENAKLASNLLTLKAGNPFSDWDAYTEYALSLTAKMQESLDKLYSRLNDFLKKEKGIGAGTTPETPSFTPPSQPPFTPPSQPPFTPSTKEDGTKAAEEAAAAAAAAAEAAAAAAAAIAAATSQAEKIAAEEAARAAAAAAEAAAAQNEAAAALLAAAAAQEAANAAAEAAQAQQVAELLASDAAARAAADALTEASFTFEESVMGAFGAGVPINNIYVTVEGSVTAVQDLAEVITDIQYEYQRNGKGLRFSSIAI